MYQGNLIEVYESVNLQEERLGYFLFLSAYLQKGTLHDVPRKLELQV